MMDIKGKSTGQMSQVNEDKHQESIINAKQGILLLCGVLRQLW